MTFCSSERISSRGEMFRSRFLPLGLQDTSAGSSAATSCFYSRFQAMARRLLTLQRPAATKAAAELLNGGGLRSSFPETELLLDPGCSGGGRPGAGLHRCSISPEDPDQLLSSKLQGGLTTTASRPFHASAKALLRRQSEKEETTRGSHHG